jgi:electron transfer flavoprotein alpha subunit
MPNGLLVFIETRGGAVKKSSLEALAAARRLAEPLGEPVTALAVGGGDGTLGHWGADRLLRVEAPLLDGYSPEGYAAVVAAAARELEPRVILGAAGAMGRDFLPRVAARLGVGLAQDCIDAALVDGALRCTRPIYAGKAFARVRLTRSPAMATLRPNVFPMGAPEASREAEVVAFGPAIDPARIRARATGLVASPGSRAVLTEASIVVSGGRALKGPENFGMIQELADALGGAMGASRAAVDAGWIDHQYQVGQTGKTVSPALYVACGISGAVQHLAGMSSSKTIVAINKDPEAPIFKIADYGIVGDIFTVVPALTAEIRRLKGQG